MAHLLFLIFGWHAARAQWRPLTPTIDCASHLSLEIFLEADNGAPGASVTTEHLVFQPDTAFEPNDDDHVLRALDELRAQGVPLIYYPNAFRHTRFERELLLRLAELASTRHRAQPLRVAGHGFLIFDYSWGR